MICPQCKKEFTPEKAGQIYCSVVPCRNRAQRERATARHNAKLQERMATMTHPCRRCGGPAPYRKSYCDKCKATKRGEGVAPLHTKTIKAARQRELEMINRVVERAIREGRQGPQDILGFSRNTIIGGVKVG
jgi:hypothetical protein